MTLRHISDLKAPIGEVIDSASPDGVLLEPEGRPTYAVIPLDDELLDYLLERSPRLRDECARIRERMRQGEFTSHDEARRILEA